MVGVLGVCVSIVGVLNVLVGVVGVFRPPGRNLAISGHSPNTYISTPNFETYLTKLVGTIRVTKKMTNFDYGDGPGRNYGETAVFTFCRKAENGPKIRFFPKKTSEIC